MLLEGKKVYVGPFLRRQERGSDSGGRRARVWVQGGCVGGG